MARWPGRSQRARHTSLAGAAALVLVALLLVMLWPAPRTREPVPPASAAPPANAAVPPSAPASARPAPAATADVPASSTAAEHAISPPTANTPTARPSAPPPSQRALAPSLDEPMPALTRRLTPPGRVNIDKREWAVLGTREVSVDQGLLTTLVLRDEVSGQLIYRQPALRVVLNEGQDYERFIQSRPDVRRLFVNALFGDIGVDAAQIAAEYMALSRDARVSRVIFIPLEVQPRPK